MRRDDLLEYYERELRFIRRMAADFAEKYPEVAGRLLLEPTKCDDPHIERLIESFAMLTARVQLRLDDGFADINESLLDVLYPHYLRPVPAGYAASRSAGENLVADPDLHALVDRIDLVTSGPLFSAERWRAIADLHGAFARERIARWAERRRVAGAPGLR